MEMIIIRKSITINATPQKIWKIITEMDYIKKWAAAFYEGTYVETTWAPDALVTWYYPDGQIAAKGKVAEFDPPFKIRINYFDDINTIVELLININKSCI